MTHQEIREKFIKFFEARGHKAVPSSSLLPTDSSVLFTTAGMQQFKPYYTGDGDAIKDFGSLNTVSIQKSMRTSDIDSVGDESHLTFFEMLGNFSFGGYWKKEAIEYAHEFITSPDWMNLKIDYVSVFAGEEGVPADEESEKIWKSLDSSLEVKHAGRDDNFWGPTGSEGPCGPTTEIYVNGIEIWNLVLNQYYQHADGHLEPLKIQGIDTGMGLERLTMVAQKKSNLFETDLLSPLIEILKNSPLKPLDKERSYRIMADHLRASIFLIADGVSPSNKEQGYILRRLIRRATMHSGIKSSDAYPFMEIYDVIMDLYKTYSILQENKKEIETILCEEVKRFSTKITEGEEKYLKLGKNISGKDAFLLHSSYGFPIELLEELVIRDGKILNKVEFEEEEKRHREISMAGAEKKFGGHGIAKGDLTAANEEELAIKIKYHTTTHLLQASLRKILGEGVHQAGSDINAERLRFDFSFERKMASEEIKQVDDLINDAIKQNLSVSVEEMKYDDAVKSGALAFFKLKYPENVTVYTIGDTSEPFSREVCGGPHVQHTGEIGQIKITKEEAVSAGIRRIRVQLTK